MTTKDIEVYSPQEVSEAVQVLAEAGPDATILAGGTDLMVALQKGQWRPQGFLLDVSGLEDELRYIVDSDSEIRIGALTTFSDIMNSELLAAQALPLVAAAREVGARQTQNRATLGGNVMNASPAGDSLPALLALGAGIVVTSNEGPRTLPLFSFYTGYRKTVAKPSELLTEIRIAKPREHSFDYFRKVGPRRAQAIAKVVFSAQATGFHVADDGPRINSLRLAIGSVAPFPMRLFETERLLVKEALSPAAGAAAVDILLSEITPIDDLRSTAAHRRLVAGRLLEDFLSALLSAGY